MFLQQKGKAGQDILDVLLDEKNIEPIVLYDENDKKLEFEQVAVITYGQGTLYCILKPISKIDEVEGAGAIVFEIVENAIGGSILIAEENDEIADKVFEQYQELLERDA